MFEAYYTGVLSSFSDVPPEAPCRICKSRDGRVSVCALCSYPCHETCCLDSLVSIRSEYGAPAGVSDSDSDLLQNVWVSEHLTAVERMHDLHRAFMPPRSGTGSGWWHWLAAHTSQQHLGLAGLASGSGSAELPILGALRQRVAEDDIVNRLCPLCNILLSPVAAAAAS